MNIWLATRSQIQSICENLPCLANFVVENWIQLVIIMFSSAVRVAKRYSKNQNIFVGFSKMLKNIMVKNWILSRYAFISFRVRMLKSKNLKMGTSSKAPFTSTVRTVSVYIAKADVLIGILFILLYWGFETSLI